MNNFEKFYKEKMNQIVQEYEMIEQAEIMLNRNNRAKRK